jgi:hypothetical protein
MNYLDELDEEEMQEVENELRLQMKLMVKGLEIFWEELQKSTLPDEVKLKLLEGYKAKGGN